MKKNFLSATEAIIMKAIWSAEGRKICTCDLLLILKEQYGKEYARSTVITFLEKLTFKGFVRCRKEGKYSYIESLRDEEEYVAEVLNRQVDYWYDGNVAKAISALVERKKINKKDLEQIVAILGDAEEMR